MRLMVAGFVVVALIVVAAATPRPRPPSIELSAAAMPTLQELHTMAGVHKLPTQDFEDQSLVYPTVAKP
jgi:hypothetical protein